MVLNANNLSQESAVKNSFNFMKKMLLNNYIFLLLLPIFQLLPTYNKFHDTRCAQLHTILHSNASGSCQSAEIEKLLADGAVRCDLAKLLYNFVAQEEKLNRKLPITLVFFNADCVYTLDFTRGFVKNLRVYSPQEYLSLVERTRYFQEVFEQSSC